MNESESVLQRLRQLEKAVQTLQIGVTITDTSGRIVYVNPADAEMHGYTVEELVGEPARMLAPPALWKPLEKRELREVSSWSRESVNLRKDGSRFPVLVTSDVVLDESGSPLGIVTSCQDISERHAADEALRVSEMRYALAVRGANDGIWDWDLDSGQVYYSPRWIAMVGAAASDVEPSPDAWLQRVHPIDCERLQTKIEDHLAGRTPHLEDEHRMLHGDGSYRWMRSRGLAVRDEAGQVRRMAGSLADITDLKVRDPLTGLPNRNLLVDRLDHCMARSRRRREETFAVLFFDVDRFKIINDSLGHLVGDQLLTAIAARVEQVLRPGDTLARYGGDEFVVLLEDVSESGDVLGVAKRIHEVLREPVTAGDRELFVTVSIGIRSAAEDHDRAQDVLSDADLAMYRAKALGGARSALFDPSMRVAATERLRVETGLRKAVENGELRVRYQPIVVLDTGAIVGLEALLRWQAPNGRLLEPAEFLPIAEETGLIVPIGEWVLREACRQMHLWQGRFPTRRPLSICVNVSPKQVEQPGFADLVTETLASSELDPASLVLEITETVVLGHNERVAATLGELRETGVRISIDDFGTGYSSLSYLHSFPVDVLKIDRSFVGGLGHGGRGAQLIETILRLGLDLGLDVIAEGVETPDQLGDLRSLSCRFGQGFTFSEPVDAERAGELIEALAPPRR